MANALREKVEEFAKALELALGDNLVSLLLYGPAVREEGTGDATTLLILRDASPQELRSIHPAIAQWTKKRNPPPLIFAEQGWRRSSDVFPIEIEDMREAHLLIRGQDPLEGMETSPDDLRRELEREARGKLLRLRTEIAAAPSGKALGALLVDSARTFFVLFRATLRLAGRSPAQDPQTLVREIGNLTGIDVDAFDWILGAIAGRKVRSLESHDPVGDRYLEQIERLTNFVDSFDVVRDSTAQEARE